MPIQKLLELPSTRLENARTRKENSAKWNIKNQMFPTKLLSKVKTIALIPIGSQDLEPMEVTQLVDEGANVSEDAT